VNSDNSFYIGKNRNDAEFLFLRMFIFTLPFCAILTAFKKKKKYIKTIQKRIKYEAKRL
jgi:ABC-type multidrug transport system permease subunit